MRDRKKFAAADFFEDVSLGGNTACYRFLGFSSPAALIGTSMYQGLFGRIIRFTEIVSKSREALQQIEQFGSRNGRLWEKSALLCSTRRMIHP